MNQSSFILVAVIVSTVWADNFEVKAKKYIDEVYETSNKLGIESSIRQWIADTADDKTQRERATKLLDDANDKYDAYQNKVFKEVKSYPWKTFKNEDLNRKFYLVSTIGEEALSKEKQTKLQNIQDGITKISASARVGEYNSADKTPKLKYEDVRSITIKHDLNYDELCFYWKKWHDALGKPAKKLFTESIELENEAARLNDYGDISIYWQEQYEIDDFESTVRQMYDTILPFYKELHAYVRHKLWMAYGKNDSIVDRTGPIQSVLLGFMGNQDRLDEILVPFPKKPSSLDISAALKTQKYTSKKFTETADIYFKSLGLPGLPESFWKNSVFEKRGDMECNPNNYDFTNGKDFRLVFCTDDPTTDDFIRVHELVGSTEYAISYKGQPYFYKQAPFAFSSAFQAFIGDLVRSPTYLKSLGLIDSKILRDKEVEINILLREAMLYVFWTPFRYAYDRWRWEVAQGKIKPQNYNCGFWKIWSSLQGVEPPMQRTEGDFDVGFNTEFLNGDQFIAYFLESITRYDLMRGVCIAAGYYDPETKPNNSLKRCDISNSKEAGKKLKEMMAMGNSRPLSDVLEKLTGHRKVDATALLEYYEPLYRWLKEENKKNNQKTGWNFKRNRCK